MKTPAQRGELKQHGLAFKKSTDDATLLSAKLKKRMYGKRKPPEPPRPTAAPLNWCSPPIKDDDVKDTNVLAEQETRTDID